MAYAFDDDPEFAPIDYGTPATAPPPTGGLGPVPSPAYARLQQLLTQGTPARPKPRWYNKILAGVAAASGAPPETTQGALYGPGYSQQLGEYQQQVGAAQLGAKVEESQMKAQTDRMQADAIAAWHKATADEANRRNKQAEFDRDLQLTTSWQAKHPFARPLPEPIQTPEVPATPGSSLVPSVVAPPRVPAGILPAAAQIPKNWLPATAPDQSKMMEPTAEEAKRMTIEATTQPTPAVLSQYFKSKGEELPPRLTPQVMQTYKDLYESDQRAATAAAALANRGDRGEQGTYIPLTDEKGVITGAWNPKANKLVPSPVEGARRSGLPATELKDRANIEVMMEDAANLRKLGEKHKGVIGRVSGILSDVQRKNLGVEPDVNKLFNISDDLADRLLRSRSGTQITNIEYERLRSLVPDPRRPYEKFMADLDLFESSLKRTYKYRTGHNPPTNGAPDAPTPTAAFKYKAVGPGGHTLGSNDDGPPEKKRWYDVQTGKPVGRSGQ